MWLFTEHGFLSVVQDQERTGRFLLVRARKREDLDELIDRLRQYMGGNLLPVRVTPERDYRYRISAPANLVAVCVMEMITGIDYGNFKDRVHDIDPSSERSMAYMKVWQAMANFQDDRHPPNLFDQHAGKIRSAKSVRRAERRRKKNKVRQWKG